MRYFLIVLLILISTAQAADSSLYQEYKVQRGQSIGKILFDLGISPLWGPKGNVRKTIEMNSDLLDKNGNVVQANSIIKIPVVDHVREISNIPEETRSESVSAPKSKESVSDSILNSALSVTAGFQYWEMKSTEKDDGSRAKIESQVSPSVDARWSTKWDESNETFMGVGYASITFKQPNTKSIKEASQGFGDLYIGHKYRFNSDWILSGEFRNIQRPYLRALNNSDLKVESPWMKQLHLGIEKKVISKKNASLSLRFSPYYIMGKEMDDFNIRSGVGGRIDIRLRQEFKNFSTEASFFSDYSQQNSNITKQQTQYNGFLFRVNLPLGGE